MRLVPAALAALLLALPAAAQPHGPSPDAPAETASATLGDLRIEGVWVRAALAPGGASAAYMTIETTGEPDRLVAVSTPVARRAELHAHLMDEAGVARMRPVEAVAVEPGSPTTLQPGGLHVMLMGVEAPLAEGDAAPLTLTFERAGEVAVDAPVRAFGAGPAPTH